MNPKGVVAAGHRLTASAGADVLHEGGTAVDAVIAALAMACVCEPVLCSPGGGGFAMVRIGSTGATSLIDFFPQTPVDTRPGPSTGVTEILADFGTATQAFHIGPGTTASPGFFAGLRSLHATAATIPLDELIAPAARAARNGVTITPFQHFLATVVRPILTATTHTGALFAPDGEVLAAGATFRNPGLADALELLAGGSFATSPVGSALLDLQREGGHLTFSDLSGYEAIQRVPLVVDIGGATVHMNPPPAAGGTLIAHSLAALGSPDPVGIARTFHETDVARRNADGDLAALDPAGMRQRGTTHVSVIDGEGTACAVTTSNGSGNGEIVGEFGFMPNNILGEEDVNPDGTDQWPKGTRLASGMCPTFITRPDGSLTALGSGGSNRIRTAISQVVVQLCLHGATLEAAVNAPRLHVENGHLDFEDFHDERTRQALTSAFPDHRVWPERNLFFGGVHAARVDADGRLSGVGDTRRDGTAIVVS